MSPIFVAPLASNVSPARVVFNVASTMFVPEVPSDALVGRKTPGSANRSAFLADAARRALGAE